MAEYNPNSLQVMPEASYSWGTPPSTGSYSSMAAYGGGGMGGLGNVGQDTPMNINAGGIDWFGENGVAIPGIQALTGLGSLYLGSQALDEQKKSNQFNQKLTRTNLANQAQLLNQRMADRYAARQAQKGTGENTAGYADRLSQFKATNQIKGTL